MNNFSEEIKHLRQELGLSQQKLGELLEISRNTIRDWELENRTPPAYVQKLLIEKLQSMLKKKINCYKKY